MRISDWSSDVCSSDLSGLVIAGVFAAAMSTLDSSMNSMSAVITTDFYKRLKPEATDKQHLKVARFTTLGLGVIGIGAAIYMALLQNASMWDQYLKVVGLFGGRWEERRVGKEVGCTGRCGGA